MRGLTAAERRALEPVGPPGQYAANDVLAALVLVGRARWAPPDEGDDDDRPVFEPTELGLLALRVCPPPR